jgi:hypothetical protein
MLLTHYIIGYFVSWIPSLFVLYYNINKKYMCLTNLLFIVLFYYLNYNQTQKLIEFNKKLFYLCIIHSIIFWIIFVERNINFDIQRERFEKLEMVYKFLYLIEILLIFISDRLLIYYISLYFYNITNYKTIRKSK